MPDTDHPLFWTRPSFLAHARAWTHEQLERLNRPATGPIEHGWYEREIVDGRQSALIFRAMVGDTGKPLRA